MQLTLCEKQITPCAKTKAFWPNFSNGDKPGQVCFLEIKVWIWIFQRLHFTGCTAGCTVGWTSVYMMQPVVQPVVQLVLSCICSLKYTLWYWMFFVCDNSVRMPNDDEFNTATAVGFFSCKDEVNGSWPWTVTGTSEGLYYWCRPTRIQSQMCVRLISTCRTQEAITEGPRDMLRLQLCAMFHEVWELERFQTAKLTFMVIKGHWQWCRSMGHIRFVWFPISVPLQLLSSTISKI